MKTLEIINGTPIADAGIDLQKPEGSTIVLNGDASFDPDGEELSYEWQMLEIPEGSTSELSDPNAVYPTFLADAVGEYHIGLTVNDGRVNSEMDEVVVTITVNQEPIANAGEDFEVYTGTMVKLNGLNSYDPEDIMLAFNWTLVEKPEGSSATLNDPGIARPEFEADEAGDYLLQLRVNDGYHESNTDEVRITAVVNQLPVADAGEDKTIKVNEELTLDGSASYDPEGTALTYLWTIITRPSGSSALVANNSQAVAEIVPDVVGQYSIRLDVSDGHSSATDYVNITVEKGTSIHEMGRAQAVNFYPNPFTNKVFFDSAESYPGKVSYEVYNVTGVKIYQLQSDGISEGQNTLDLSGAVLKDGIYILRMKGDQQPVRSYRLMHRSED